MRKYKKYINKGSERNISKQEYYITELNEKEQPTARHISRYLLRNLGMPLGLAFKAIFNFLCGYFRKKGTLNLYSGIHIASMGRAVAWCLTLWRRNFTFKF